MPVYMNYMKLLRVDGTGGESKVLQEVLADLKMTFIVLSIDCTLWSALERRITTLNPKLCSRKTRTALHSLLPVWDVPAFLQI